MPHRSLAEVGARLEEAAALLPDPPTDPEGIFDRYEQVAIAILDSEHTDFVPGELEEYLNVRLYLRRLELGLIEFPDRDHQ
ncbi:hypothetical protein [Pseudohaliea sp.]|uniref:hypothetical protein n=1 Tax=Pseudohaliea sp. TaxID=2740289 RepID=UPI0032EB26BF